MPRIRKIPNVYATSEGPCVLSRANVATHSFRSPRIFDGLYARHYRCHVCGMASTTAILGTVSAVCHRFGSVAQEAEWDWSKRRHAPFQTRGRRGLSSERLVVHHSAYRSARPLNNDITLTTAISNFCKGPQNDLLGMKFE